MNKKLFPKDMKQHKILPEFIGVVGLGLIGGSISLELKSLGFQVKGLVHKASTAKRAKERGLAQEISTDPRILKKCGLIIIALPLEKILEPSHELISAFSKDAVVTDVGSVKAPVVKIWREIHSRFIGSHPMAGNNKIGVEAGQIGLFRNRPWVSTPENDFDQEALGIIQQLAISLGATWLTTDAKIHDEAVALISHLPVFISAALINTINSEKDISIKKLAKELASSGFSDTSRVGGGNPELGTAMAVNNTKAILKAFNYYRASLDKLEEIILNNQWLLLKEELEKSQITRSDLMEK